MFWGWFGVFPRSATKLCTPTAQKFIESVINLRKYLVTLSAFIIIISKLRDEQLTVSDFYMFHFYSFLLVHFVLEASGYKHIWVLKIVGIKNLVALLKFLKLYFLFSQILGS